MVPPVPQSPLPQQRPHQGVSLYQTRPASRLLKSTPLVEQASPPANQAVVQEIQTASVYPPRWFSAQVRPPQTSSTLILTLHIYPESLFLQKRLTAKLPLLP